MNPILAKILRTFFTSLVLFYSRKIIYYLDIFFSDTFSEDRYVICDKCNNKFRLDIAEEQYDNCCPYCKTSAWKKTDSEIRNKILKGYNRNDGNHRCRTNTSPVGSIGPGSSS